MEGEQKAKMQICMGLTLSGPCGWVVQNQTSFFTYFCQNLVKSQLDKIIIHAKLNRNSKSAALPSTKIKMKGDLFEQRKYDLN